MAQSVQQDSVSCCKFLDLLKDSVMTHCGHSGRLPVDIVERQTCSQEQTQLSPDTENTEPATIHTGDQSYFDEVTQTLPKLKDTFEQGPAELSSRDDFLQYSTEITLDPNSAHTLLSLSDGNRRATCMSKDQRYPDHPDRFTVCQVLSRESLTGRCYWEVEWSGWWARIAVSYRDIQRKEFSNECLFGDNDKSWALECESDSYSFWFNKFQVSGPVSGPVGSRIGVYLDHSAGVLAFYSVSESTMSLLHRVQTRFTQPVYTGVWIYNTESTAHFLKVK